MGILVCEFCQKEGTEYTKGKTSGKSLCKKCYQYEYRHGYLVPLDKQKKHKDRITNQSNPSTEAEKYPNGNEDEIKEQKINARHVLEKKNEKKILYKKV